MKIIHLFTKTKEGFQEKQSLKLIKDTGIENDINALRGNPRQILIVSNPVIKEFNLNPSDLKANIIIDTEIENFKSGQVIQFGEAMIRLTFHCEPCYKLEKFQKGLAKKIIGRRGFLGTVIRDGSIKVDDALILTDIKMSEFSDIPKERFFNFILQIPKGNVIKTSDLLIALGLAKGYYRAIPGYLKNSPDNIPIHRIVTVYGELMEKYIPYQKEKLLSEGVVIEDNKVQDKFYLDLKNLS